jgi:DNA invertase Pin-like site-specific DNA recombinase
MEQHTIRQEILMSNLMVDEVFIDQMSGKNIERPQLKRMLDFVRKGDTVIVESISRFARNTRDLLDLIDTLTNKEVAFVSQKENIDTTTPTGRFMLTVFAAVAQLEREYLLQRQREGIDIAKQQGKYTGRKPVDPPNYSSVMVKYRSGSITATKAATLLGISRSTFYRKLK